MGLINTDSSSTGDRFAADHIEIVGDRDPTYNFFDEGTRIAIARRGLIEAVTRNASVVRFGLLRMRQSSPRYETPASSEANKWNVNEGPVTILNGAYLSQQLNGDITTNRWRITRPIVNSINGSIGGPVAPLVAPDSQRELVHGRAVDSEHPQSGHGRERFAAPGRARPVRGHRCAGGQHARRPQDRGGSAHCRGS